LAIFGGEPFLAKGSLSPSESSSRATPTSEKLSGAVPRLCRSTPERRNIATPLESTVSLGEFHHRAIAANPRCHISSDCQAIRMSLGHTIRQLMRIELFSQMGTVVFAGVQNVAGNGY
jgi:hypothetical protein